MYKLTLCKKKITIITFSVAPSNYKSFPSNYCLPGVGIIQQKQSEDPYCN